MKQIICLEKVLRMNLDLLVFQEKLELMLGLKWKIDIEHGEIECGITARTEEGAKASVECSQSYTKELEKQLSKKKLPNYQFLVAGIPIVVTNELEIFANAEMSLEGNIGASYELTSETTQGFSI